MQRKAIKYKLRSKQIWIKSKLILMHVQYTGKTDILISRKQLGISQEKFIHMYVSSLRKNKTGSLERFFLSGIGHHQYRRKTKVEILLILKFNCSKSVTLLKMKQYVDKLYDKEFTRQIKIEESEEEEEIPIMVINVSK